VNLLRSSGDSNKGFRAGQSIAFDRLPKGDDG
jgi:hypothetical protein